MVKRAIHRAKLLTAAVTRRMKIPSAIQYDSVLSRSETFSGQEVSRERHGVGRRPPQRYLTSRVRPNARGHSSLPPSRTFTKDDAAPSRMPG